MALLSLSKHPINARQLVLRTTEHLGNATEIIFLRRWQRYFAGDVSSDGTIGFNLEADNPANYTTTMVDGEEVQVYNGPTLDIKERILNFVDRIAELEAKVAQLEADHAQMMGNNNGGY